MEQQNKCGGYAFCTIGAIVCDTCHYPVTSGNNNNKAIYWHEYNNKSHPIKAAKNVRHEVANAFEKFTEKIAHEFVNELPNHDAARGIILGYIAPVHSYPYCSMCKILVHDARSHKNRAHTTYCQEIKDGYASKYWSEKNPKIIQVGFDIADGTNYCPLLWTKIQAEMVKQRKQFAVSPDNDATALQNIFLDQEIAFTEAEQNQQLVAVDQRKHPDLWILRSGWYEYLEHFNEVNIRNATLPYDERTHPNEIVVEKTLRTAITDMVADLRKVECTHQMFFEVERQHDDYPLQPFRLVQDKTYVRYTSEICAIIRVINRIHKYQSNISDSDAGDRRYPKIKFTDRQNAAIIAMNTPPASTEKSIELLLSLVDQIYIASPYECAFICALAFVSVNAKSTYITSHTYCCKFSAYLGIYKLVILYASKQNDSGVTCINQIKEYVKKFISHPKNIMEYPNAMSWMINLYNYGAAISKSTTRDGFLGWKEHVLYFKHIRLSILDFKVAIKRKIDEAGSLLLRLCNKSKLDELPEIPWGSTFDDFNNTSPNYSFLTDPHNSYYTRISRQFISQMSGTHWISEDGGINVDTLQSYRKTVIDFLKIMLCLVHITGGQPARGSEITILQHTNSNNSSRNIFIHDGLVCIYTYYHKNMIHTDRPKIIYRYLPPCVGQLLVYYLWLVLPSYQCIVGNHENKNFRSTFLWTFDIVDSAPTTKTWDTRMLGSILNQFFTSTMGFSMNVADYRHIPIAIVRRYLHNKVSLRYDNDESEPDEETDGTNFIWDTQAGHTRGVAIRVYARQYLEHDSSSNSIMALFRMISIIWHQFLLDQNIAVPIKSSIIHQSLEEQRKKRWATLKKRTSIGMLHEFMDENAQFRGRQLDVIDALRNGERYILQIAATGVGKSLSFMLPAYCTHMGTTIVIVPLLALQNDLVSRCCAKNIIAAPWNEVDYFGGKDIVFVTPESACTDRFWEYINFLLVNHQLDRIVIDECHQILFDADEFRVAMAKIKVLLQACCVQVLMLTATLPVTKEGELYQWLGIGQPVTVIRDHTVRKNIHYRIMNTTENMYLTNIQSILARVTSGKCIIYVRTIEVGNNISGALKLPFYFSEADGKHAMYEKWAKTNEAPVIIATGALGCGVDIPDIRYIIHVGATKTLTEFVQGSGRAGRDGVESFSYLLHFSKIPFSLDDDMNAYVSETRCRRCVIDSVMDGDTSRQACCDNESKCDLCHRKPPPPPPLAPPSPSPVVELLDSENDNTVRLSDPEPNISEQVDTAYQSIVDDCMAEIYAPVPVEPNQVQGRKRLRDHAEKITNDDARQQRQVLNSVIENERISEECLQLVTTFTDIIKRKRCLVCAIEQRTSGCPAFDHIKIQKRANERSETFMKKYRDKKFKLEKYVACFKCFSPQKWWYQVNGNDICDCCYKDTKLKVIHTIVQLDNSLNDTNYNHLEYMLQSIGSFGNIENVLMLTKVFYDIVVAFRTKNR